MSIHCPTVRMCGLNYLEAPIWGILPGFLSEDSILCYLTLAVFINGVLPYDALWGFPCLVLISQTQEKNARTLHPLWLILPPLATCKTVRHPEWERTLGPVWQGKVEGEASVAHPCRWHTLPALLPPGTAFTCSAVTFTAHSVSTFSVCV